LADWESIVRTHGPMAFDTAWRLLGHVADTEDVVQEALLDAFDLHGGSRSAIGVGYCANWPLGGHRQAAAAPHGISAAARAACIRAASPKSEQPKHWRSSTNWPTRLRLAVAALPEPPNSTVFSLHYFGEMSNSDIAETLGSALMPRAWRFHKARKKTEGIARRARGHITVSDRGRRSGVSPLHADHQSEHCQTTRRDAASTKEIEIRTPLTMSHDDRRSSGSGAIHAITAQPSPLDVKRVL